MSISVALECSLRLSSFYTCIRETVILGLGTRGLYSKEKEKVDQSTAKYNQLHAKSIQANTVVTLVLFLLYYNTIAKVNL